MALRSNMAAWSGCFTHRDIIYKTEDKNQSIYFVYPPVTKHTHSGTKGQFFNHMNVKLCNCNRPLPLLSVLYNDNRWLYCRGGWGEEIKGGLENTGGPWCHVDALFQSCPPGWERLAELASLVHQFPLPQESHVQHTHDKQHVWFWQKWKLKNKNKG